MSMRFYYQSTDAPTPNRPPLIGSVAIIQRGNKVLLEQRVDSERWAFIGGAMNDDESAEDAMIREVKEETNLSVTTYRLIGAATDPSRIIAYSGGDVRRVITFIYVAEVESFVDIQPSEESRALEFYVLDEINEKVALAESHKPVLNIARAYLIG